jgi:cyclopropane fatty-acyl-phospholipid synthase-like methyltransferase
VTASSACRRPPPRSEQEIAARFAERYRAEQAGVTRQIEQAVIGGDWGANGYTSRAQAGLLARLLELRPGVRLLDLGAGRGWPGLYLAASTGCQVVLADIPVQGLVSAMARATREQLSGRAAAAAASARRLPFRPAVFDAVVHTDVLCCLRPKLSVLRACHRVLRPGGRTAFFTIHPAAGLSPARRRRASRDGPVAVATARPYREMLESAGFTEVYERDCTEEFAAVARAWIEQWDRHRDGLVSVFGEQAVQERQADRRTELRAIEDGVLSRSLFTAVHPGPVRRAAPGDRRPRPEGLGHLALAL